MAAAKDEGTENFVNSESRERTSAVSAGDEMLRSNNRTSHFPRDKEKEGE